MKKNIPQWQRKIVKEKVLQYRQALQNYYINEKQLIELENGQTAFSLLSPPIGSVVARRRLKLIMDSLTAGNQTQLDARSFLKNRHPHFITIAITYDCQCQCSHCSAANYQRPGSFESLSVDEIKRAIDESLALGSTCIVFTGGEPLLHAHVCELIAHVHSAKAISTLFTNGEYLDSQCAKALKRAKTYGVFVSFDYAQKDLHDNNRGRSGIFQKAVRAVKCCQDQGILTGISTFATKEKLRSGELDRIMDLAKDIGVLEVFIFDVIPVGKLANNPHCALQESDFDAIKQLRLRYNMRPDYPRIIHQTMLTNIAYPCTGEGCPAGIAHMHIRANGDVSPCDFTPYSFGNLRTRSLGELWHAMSESPWYGSPSSTCRLSDPHFLKALGDY